MSSRINILETILSCDRTVFTAQSLLLLTGCSDNKKLMKSLHYYSKEKKLLNPRRGIYTKHNYDEREMACSLYRPSYISLEYVLQRAGVVFQWDDTITCVSYLSRKIMVDGKEYHFRKINPELWIGMEGVEQQGNIAIATPERAFLDTMYLSAGYCYFDNLNALSIKKIYELLPLYRSSKLNKRVETIIKDNNG